MPTQRRAVLAVALPFIALALSVAVAVYSFWHMDGERLFWEGGYQYFCQRFPFAAVLGLTGLGLVSGAIGMFLARRFRGVVLLGIACNLVWAGWWGRHLIR